MNVLAIECAQQTCSIALSANGQVVEAIDTTPRGKAKRVLVMIDDLLRSQGLCKTDIETIVVGSGPGSFTGLRIAVGIAQGLAFGLGIRVVPVSTLAAMALASFAIHKVVGNYLVCLDARQNEVYYGAYHVDGQTAEAMLPMGVCNSVDLDLVRLLEVHNEQPWIGVGSGWINDGATLLARCGVTFSRVMAEQSVRASDLLALGLQAIEHDLVFAPHEVQPVYCRDKVVNR